MLPVYRLNLTVMKDIFGVCKLPAGAEIPEWAWRGPFASVTRTDEETSIVCLLEHVPQGILVERDWRCIKVDGPLEFTLVGLLSSLLIPLSEAEISIFAVSTYNTDYILLKERDLESAVHALTQAGFAIGRRGA